MRPSDGCVPTHAEELLVEMNQHAEADGFPVSVKDGPWAVGSFPMKMCKWSLSCLCHPTVTSGNIKGV